MTSEQTKKFGVRKALLVVIATVLIISPAYVAKTLLNRITLDISMVALVALAMLVVGMYLLLKLARY